MIADDLRLGAIDDVAKIILAAGYDEVEEDGEDVGYVWFEVSDDNGVTKSAFQDGTTRKKVARSIEAQPAMRILGTQEILVSLTYNWEVRSYLSSDFGETWTYLDALP